METQARQAKSIRSLYADDPRVAPIIPFFLGRLNQIVGSMRDSAVKQDWKTVRTVSHQLKGSAGGYGFPELMQAAALVETEVKKDTPEEEQLHQLIDGCEDLCKRMLVN